MSRAFGQIEESKYAMIAMSEAIQSVESNAAALFSQLSPLWTELVALSESQGRVLSEDLVSPTNIPPFPASIMDGYAVVASDGPGEYCEVGGFQTAGANPEFSVARGQVSYVTTGGVVPQGADAVVKVEWTRKTAKQSPESPVKVQILQKVEPGTWIRPVGSDIRKGERILVKGTRIGAPEIGLCAHVGITNIPVFRVPKVGVLSSGNEICEPGSELGRGKIWDSNRAMLIAAIKKLDCDVVDLGIAKDSEQEIENIIKNAINRVDVLISTGGVSMGNADFIKPILEKLGKIHFGRLLMKPGKPTTFASVKDDQGVSKLVFALPGNPVSCLVTFHLLVKPAVLALSGIENSKATRISVRLTQNIKMDPERPEFHRALVIFDLEKREFASYSTGNQLSSRLLSMYGANALLEIPQGSGVVPKGSFISAVVIGDISNRNIGSGIVEPLRKDACCEHHLSAEKKNHFEESERSDKSISIALLVCSDRASTGNRADRCVESFEKTLKKLQDEQNERLRDRGKSSVSFKIIHSEIVPDDEDTIANMLMDWSDAQDNAPNIIFTLGGTGFGVITISSDNHVFC